MTLDHQTDGFFQEQEKQSREIFGLIFLAIAVGVFGAYKIQVKATQVKTLTADKKELAAKVEELKKSPPILPWSDLRERGSFRVEWRGRQDQYETSINIYTVRRMTPRAPGEGDTYFLAYGLPQDPEVGWTCAYDQCTAPTAAGG